MRIIEKNRFRMVQAVLNFLKNTPGAVLLLLPLLSNLTNALELIVNAILAADQSQSDVAKGEGAGKEAKKKALVDIATSVGRALLSYAGNVNDVVLQDKVKSYMKDLERQADVTLITNCKNIDDKAKSLLAKLASVGVTQAVMTSLEGSIADYQNQSSNLRNKIAQRKDATKSIATLLKQAGTLLRTQLDPLVRSLRNQTSYVDMYNSNRLVIDTGHRYTQFKGVTVIKGTGIVLSNVELEFKNAERSVKIKTDNEGKYREVLNPDVYDIIVTHPDYKPFVIEGVKIVAGEIKVENFELTPKV